MNVDAMLADMEPSQFNEWIAYHQLEPWGDEWVQTGTIAAAVHNSQGQKVSALDFIPGQSERVDGLADIRESVKRIGGVK